MVKVREDLTGKQFGRLTVIKQVEDYVTPKNKIHHAQWLCECNCQEHNQIVVVGSNLKRKNGTCSCGCLQKENAHNKLFKDLTGKRFGRLLVIKQVEDYIEPKRGNSHSQWLCQCDCGSAPIVVVGTSLTRKITQSCGCLAKERISEANKKYNHIEQNGDTGIGLTTNTNVEFYFDWEDYNKICNLCWIENITKDGMHKLQAYDPNTKTVVSMHSYLGYKNYDHIDRNELNNCKNNLRPANPSQNAQNHNKRSDNTSGFTGITWNKKNKTWIARINDETNHRIYLGSFADKKDAIKSRLEAELKYYGEFAPQRHLFEQYGIKKEE